MKRQSEGRCTSLDDNHPWHDIRANHNKDATEQPALLSGIIHIFAEYLRLFDLDQILLLTQDSKIHGA
jgi:hypothetical protein